MAYPYVMRISRLTVDKLGVKLYDRVSAVIAELISNSYDADAQHVVVAAPMGRYLATRAGDDIVDQGLEVTVQDDGIGMTQEEMQGFFLVVGADRRQDQRRGATSKKFQRQVMGRKGVGKLAPFGICREIEIISAGGERTTRVEDGVEVSGFETSHLTLDYDAILTDSDESYQPTAGPRDGLLNPATGTTIILRKFAQRKVPDLALLSRQVAQRFGISAVNWRVTLKDTNPDAQPPGIEKELTRFDVEALEGTKVEFRGPQPTNSVPDANGYSTVAASGQPITNVNAGFAHEGRFYPVVGWVAFAKESYRDDLMAGVRIYCRGKIAAQTAIFNRGSGFTGEQSVRAYFVGEIFCDWLDEKEDLIETNRRDILWSDDLGSAFEAWGQGLVREIGRRGRTPLRERMAKAFQITGDVRKKIEAAFPRPDQQELRDKATQIADLLGKSLREDEVNDQEIVDPLVDLSIDLAPHISLEQKLREAADSQDTPAAVIGSILRTAQLAELHSFGRIANDRVRVIESLKHLKNTPGTVEADLQTLIESAPWLIDPSWAPISANRALSSLKEEFERYYEQRTGQQIALQEFQFSNKRPDFVCFAVGQRLEIVEIKKPGHHLQNSEVERINNYYQAFRDFLNDPGHVRFREEFRDFHITLVCDGVAVSGLARSAYEGIQREEKLTQINWRDFLLRTEQMHREFLQEADRQKSYAIATPTS